MLKRLRQSLALRLALQYAAVFALSAGVLFGFLYWTLAESLNARAIGFYNRALTHEKLGDLQSAYEDFRSALQINPEFTQASEQIARFTVVPVEG